MWFGMSPVGALETEVCRYLWLPLGWGHSPSYLEVALSVLMAIEDPGWIPQMVTKKVWRCSKQPKYRDTTTTYAKLEECASVRKYFQPATNGRRSRWRPFPSRASYVWEKQRQCKGEAHTPHNGTSVRSRLTPGRWYAPWDLGRMPVSSG